MRREWRHHRGGRLVSTRMVVPLLRMHIEGVPSPHPPPSAAPGLQRTCQHLFIQLLTPLVQPCGGVQGTGE